MNTDNFMPQDMPLMAELSETLFGVAEHTLAEAILSSPNARGYIIGSISELLLRQQLESAGLFVHRVKEKWEGEKIHHGDFYISNNDKDWYVVESKGLKSNSEKWAKTAEKNLFDTLSKSKVANEKTAWFNNLSEESKLSIRTEPKQNEIRLCQTHMPSGKKTNEKKSGGRTQASPRFDEFHLLSVDMYSKTGKHEFVYALSSELSRSKKDANHLLQNYFITYVLPSDMRPIFPLATPWESNLIEIVKRVKDPIDASKMQIDDRKPGERAEGVLSF